VIFTERALEISTQRKLQLTIDEPLQYFFAFNWNNTQTIEDIDIPEDTFDIVLKANASSPVVIPTSVKFEVFPVKRNQLFVRLENIGDRFDTDSWNLTPANTTVYFPLDKWARDLFNNSNVNTNLS